MQAENTITIDGRTVDIPQSWNDLDPRDLYFCYGVAMTDHREFLLHEQVQAKRAFITDRLLGLTPEWHSTYADQLRADAVLALGDDPTDEQVTQAKADAETVYYSTLADLQVVSDFAFQQVETAEDEPAQYAVSLTLTKCPLPELQHNSRKRGKRTGKRKNKFRPKCYLAPADGLSNISIYELGVTFTLFERFMTDRNEDDLHELISILYRPHKLRTKQGEMSDYGGDRRIPHLGTETTAALRQRKVETLPLQVKQIILFWFAGCRQAIVEGYPNVFNAQPDTRKKSGNQYGWGGVLLSIAGELPQLQAVAEQKATDALTYLSYLEDQRKLQELRALEAQA